MSLAPRMHKPLSWVRLTTACEPGLSIERPA